MDWYLTLLNYFSIIFCVILFRYHWYRTRFFVHTFQQVGYKNNEYWQWLRMHWDEKVIPVDLGIFNLILFIAVAVDGFWGSVVTRSTLAVVFFVYTVFWLSSIQRYKQEKVKKPLIITNRVKRLLIPVILLGVLFPAFLTFESYSGRFLYNYSPGLLNFDIVLLVFGWVFSAILIPFFIFIASWVTKPVENAIQEGFKKQARKKLNSMPHLKIVAITGSYGKTSTKFMVRDLLKERFSVCSTPGSYNTPMGICKVINNDLQSHHQILILEMGARYEGNIQELCDIAKPDISIITNVGVAHLETFGSQKVIAKEKGTLVDNLIDGGVAILNADDELVRKMGEKRSNIERILVGLNSGDIRGNSINYNYEGTNFQLSIDEEKTSIQTRLLGSHNVQNMLLAIGAAHHFGIRAKTIALGAKNIEPIEHRLELKKSGNFFIIDDAFNSNPVGAKNAIEILAQFSSGRRIIITPGMVELGEIEFEENKKFGEVIGKANLDRIILVGEERAKPILEGINSVDGHKENITVVNSLFEANDILKSFIQAGDVVLYENDLPDLYNE
ncbi:MAG: UDP-N-acetylmuramoyl-tripeptide--D-alanyl-D-alanine ligase [Balneola sp.]